MAAINHGMTSTDRVIAPGLRAISVEKTRPVGSPTRSKTRSRTMSAASAATRSGVRMAPATVIMPRCVAMMATSAIRNVKPGRRCLNVSLARPRFSRRFKSAKLSANTRSKRRRKATRIKCRLSQLRRSSIRPVGIINNPLGNRSNALDHAYCCCCARTALRQLMSTKSSEPITRKTNSKLVRPYGMARNATASASAGKVSATVDRRSCHQSKCPAGAC